MTIRTLFFPSRCFSVPLPQSRQAPALSLDARFPFRNSPNLREGAFRKIVPASGRLPKNFVSLAWRPQPLPQSQAAASIEDPAGVFAEIQRAAASSGISKHSWIDCIDAAYPLLSREVRGYLLQLAKFWFERDVERLSVEALDPFLLLRPFLRSADLPREEVEEWKRYFVDEIEGRFHALFAVHELAMLESTVEDAWFFDFLGRQFLHPNPDIRVEILEILPTLSSHFRKAWLQENLLRAFQDRNVEVRKRAYDVLGSLNLDPDWTGGVLQKGLRDENRIVLGAALNLIAERNGRLALPWLSDKFSLARQGGEAWEELLFGLQQLGLSVVQQWLQTNGVVLGRETLFSEIFSERSPLKSGLRPEWLRCRVEDGLLSPEKEARVEALRTLARQGQGMDPFRLRSLLQFALDDPEEHVVAEAYKAIGALKAPWDPRWLRETLELGLNSPSTPVTRTAYRVLLTLGDRVDAVWFRQIVSRNISETWGDFRHETYKAFGSWSRLSVFDEGLLQSWIEQGLRDSDGYVRDAAWQALMDGEERFDPAWRVRNLRAAWDERLSSYPVRTLRELIRLGAFSREEIEWILGLDRIPA